MPWFEFKAGPAKNDIIPPLGVKNGFDIDGGTGFQISTVTGWQNIGDTDDNGIFYITTAEAQSLMLDKNGSYHIKIEKAAQPEAEAITVFNFRTHEREDSHWLAE